MDEQHKKLFSLLDELGTAMLAGTVRETFGKILRGLAEYAKTHFAQEELLLNGFVDQRVSRRYLISYGIQLFR